MNTGLWQACGSKINVAIEASITVPSGEAFSAPKAGASMWELDAKDIPNDAGYCGLYVRWDAQAILRLPLGTFVPNIFVGINRTPSGNLNQTADWDCVLSSTLPAPPGASQPTCDLPFIEDAVYHIVISSPQPWPELQFQVGRWGPKKTDRFPDVIPDNTTEWPTARRQLRASESPAPAAAGQCFTGGRCKTDKNCLSGNCMDVDGNGKKYCVPKTGERVTMRNSAK